MVEQGYGKVGGVRRFSSSSANSGRGIHHFNPQLMLPDLADTMGKVILEFLSPHLWGEAYVDLAREALKPVMTAYVAAIKPRSQKRRSGLRPNGLRRKKLYQTVKMRAGKYKETVKLPGVGHILRGVWGVIGPTREAPHAHLLEFGTRFRFRRGVNNRSRNIGLRQRWRKAKSQTKAKDMAKSFSGTAPVKAPTPRKEFGPYNRTKLSVYKRKYGENTATSRNSEAFTDRTLATGKMPEFPALQNAFNANINHMEETVSFGLSKILTRRRYTRTAWPKSVRAANPFMTGTVSGSGKLGVKHIDS